MLSTTLEAEASLKAEKKPDKNDGDGTSPDRAQRNFTDPDSHIMLASSGKHFIQAYNAQAAVDSANQVIGSRRGHE